MELKTAAVRGLDFLPDGRNFIVSTVGREMRSRTIPARDFEFWVLENLLPGMVVSKPAAK